MLSKRPDLTYNRPMATQDDVRRIAATLPGATASEEGFGFSVLNKGKHKGFAWTWNERVTPKKPKVPNPAVLAICVPTVTVKEIMMGSPWWVEDPHYNGYPAVLVRLSEIDFDELESLLIEAWRTKAPKDLLREYDGA